MSKDKNFFKVYEILDNVSDELEIYPTYFVGAFVNEADAIQLCEIIDIADCNSTKTVYGEITQEDIEDLKQFGLQSADEEALLQIERMLKEKEKGEGDEPSQAQPE